MTMELKGLDYNTQREKLKLKAYGRGIQQMVDICIALPTKAERQKCAETIIEAMKRVVPSQLSYKERTPALWYHLALMSDFKLDVDYPVQIMYEDKMATPPEKIPYGKERILARHYGKLMCAMFERLQNMPEGVERDELMYIVAAQMQRCLNTWGMGASDYEKIADDLARYTNGVIQVLPSDLMRKNDDKKKKRKRK